jgi:hypothetical protein
MADNPLAGLSIPSLDEIVDEVMSLLPKSTIDLGNAIMRDRVRQVLFRGLNNRMDTLHDAVEKSATKAVSHVFKTMLDPQYQEKRAKRRKGNTERRLVHLQERAKQEADARIALTKQKLQIVKTPTETVQ